METAKPSITFRFDHYDLEVQVLGERKVGLTVTDSLSRSQFQEKELQLEHIGANTLLRALEKTKREIQVLLEQRQVGQNSLLEVQVVVESPFLKPVREVLLLRKIRDVGEAEAVRKAIDRLGKRIKQAKENCPAGKTTLATYVMDQKYYNGSAYQPLISMKLPKGKWLLTFSYLLKAQNTWFYIYFGQGQQVMQNAGYYVPTASHFIPHTVRKIHTVVGESEQVSFTTYCASSYPVTLRNCVLTARPLPE